MSDVIADETIVTNNVTKFSLSSSADQWADKALEILSNYERKDGQPEVAKAGFDVRNTADFLQEFYTDRTLRAEHIQKNF